MTRHSYARTGCRLEHVEPFETDATLGEVRARVG